MSGEDGTQRSRRVPRELSMITDGDRDGIRPGSGDRIVDSVGLEDHATGLEEPMDKPGRVCVCLQVRKWSTKRNRAFAKLQGGSGGPAASRQSPAMRRTHPCRAWRPKKRSQFQ